MEIINRKGHSEPLDMGQVSKRLHDLVHIAPALDLPAAGVDEIVIRTVANITGGITTSQLDRYAAGLAIDRIYESPDYGRLAVRLLMSDIQKTVGATFSESYLSMAEGGRYAGMCGTANPEMARFVRDNSAALDEMIRPERDFNHDYIATLALIKNYLRSHQVKTREVQQILQETPQHCYMRTTVAGWYNREGMSREDKLAEIRRGYNLLSQKIICHATPILFNAGFANANLAPCFLLAARDDTEWIMKSGVADSGIISKACGGIGISMSDIRPNGSLIHGSGRMSSGVIPQLEIYDRTLACFNQGQKRNGSMKVWMDIWQGDFKTIVNNICEFKREDSRVRIDNLFFGAFIPDLFVKRVLENGDWSFFSSSTAPELTYLYDGMPVCRDCHYCRNPDYRRAMTNPAVISALGEHYRACPDSRQCDTCHDERVPVFTRVYTGYERAGLALSSDRAHNIVDLITAARRQKGMPDCAYKDNINRCSTQDHFGTVVCQNLCSEITQVARPDSYATCVLSSVNVGNCITKTDPSAGSIDWDLFRAATRYLVRYLDGIIDVTTPPVPTCAENIKNWRNLGIGLQGVFNAMVSVNMPYASREAAILDATMYRTLYWTALDESARAAKRYGVQYPREDSTYSAGIFQPEMWRHSLEHIPDERGSGINLEYIEVISPAEESRIRRRVEKYGVRNVHLIAQMPTTSTSVISGSVESNSAPFSLINSVDTIYGRHPTYLAQFMNQAHAARVWNRGLVTAISQNQGQIDPELIAYFRNRGDEKTAEFLARVGPLFPTIWQVDQYEIMNRAASRGRFICQSQSMNLHLLSNSNKRMRETLIHAWRIGLKTAVYYTRTRSATRALATNVDHTAQLLPVKKIDESPIRESPAPVCHLASGDCCSG